MKRLAPSLAFCVAIALTCLMAAQSVAIEIDTVPVGNSHNPADTRSSFWSVGAVDHSYRIAKTEVTHAQYVEFLNAVAKNDVYGLFFQQDPNSSVYGIKRHGSPGNFSYSVRPDVPGKAPDGTAYSFANKPVAGVSWLDAIRFTNWLHNGQGNGDTESGAYTLLGPYTTNFAGASAIPSNINAITRNPGARWWLPSQDEWYKAAYYNPDSATYALFATGSSSMPTFGPPSTDNGNSANYCLGFSNCSFPATGVVGFPLTDVGAYAKSSSPYGTFDQTGNVHEWTESSYLNEYRIGRGGSWGETLGNHESVSFHFFPPNHQRNNDVMGFRVATVPEPLLQPIVFAVLLCAVRLRARCV